MFASRINYMQFLQQELQQFNLLEAGLAESVLNPNLAELVKLRVSQINGCSFCVSYHSQRLRQLGETAERIDLVSVWSESPCFSATEIQAFRWAEALTRLSDGNGIDDDVYTQTTDVFDGETLTQLTLAVAMINVWNRFSVAFQTDHSHIADLLEMSQPHLEKTQ